MSTDIDYKKIKMIIKKHSMEISRLRDQQMKLVKQFFVLADKTKEQAIRNKIK